MQPRLIYCDIQRLSEFPQRASFCSARLFHITGIIITGRDVNRKDSRTARLTQHAFMSFRERCHCITATRRIVGKSDRCVVPESSKRRHNHGIHDDQLPRSQISGCSLLSLKTNYFVTGYVIDASVIPDISGIKNGYKTVCLRPLSC